MPCCDSLLLYVKATYNDPYLGDEVCFVISLQLTLLNYTGANIHHIRLGGI